VAGDARCSPSRLLRVGIFGMKVHNDFTGCMTIGFRAGKRSLKLFENLCKVQRRILARKLTVARNWEPRAICVFHFVADGRTADSIPGLLWGTRDARSNDARADAVQSPAIALRRALCNARRLGRGRLCQRPAPVRLLRKILGAEEALRCLLIYASVAGQMLASERDGNRLGLKCSFPSGVFQKNRRKNQAERWYRTM